MENYQLSVVIPTKNEGRYVGPTIAQFEPFLEPYNIEIIVSDANSADDTAEVVRSYQEKWGADRIKLVQSVAKQNIAIGRNLGAAAAGGRVLLHMDADVRIPRLAQFLDDILAAVQRPGVVAATAPIWVYPEESGWADKAYHLFMNTVIRLSFPFGIYLAKGECQVVRSDVFREIGGYNEKIVAGEDCNLFYRLHKEGKIAYLYRRCVYHSPRRFREYGYIRLSMIYLREGIWLLFRRKSYSEEWKPVR